MLNFKFLPPLLHGKKNGNPWIPHPKKAGHGETTMPCAALQISSMEGSAKALRCEATTTKKWSATWTRPPDHGVMGWKSMGKIPRNSNPSIYIYSIYKKYIILWWIDWRILFSGEEVLAARDSTWLDLSKVGLVGTTGPTCRGSGCRVRLESPHGQFQPGRSFKGVGIDHRGNHQAHGINKNLQWCNLFPQL